MTEAAAQIIEGFIGIDNGTQGLSVVFCRKSDLLVLATGEATYDFVDGLAAGSYEQRCEDWDRALELAMIEARKALAPSIWKVLGIGISGQMHGEVLVGLDGTPLQPVRLWCDARNEAEGTDLTKLFGTKVAKRATIARFLWTCRNRPKIAQATKHITTPAGWCAYRLTGEFHLGIGDAAGMFPIDTETKTYDTDKLQMFDALVSDDNIPPPCEYSTDHAVGIRVAAAEGDQVAALAGSLIGTAGMVSCSFGTSVCANAIGDRPFVGVSQAVDQFCSADGKPINMVWLRNGTTYLNTIMESYGSVLPNGRGDAFQRIMPKLVEAPADCGGLLALPFMDDEPGIGVTSGGTAMIVGWTAENAKAENVAKAALISTIFNLKLGCKVLDEQGYPRTEIILTGGLTKTPQCAQIVADIFNTPCHLLDSADEGCSWGAALMAKFRHERMTNVHELEWPDFLSNVQTKGNPTSFQPIEENVEVYERMFQRYQRLIQLEVPLRAALIS